LEGLPDEGSLFLFLKKMPIYQITMRYKRFFWLLVGSLCLSTVYAKIYVVESRDTILGIARKTGFSATYIRRLNQLTTDTLFVGQKIVIPDEMVSYVVQPGDTLIGIARRFGASLGDILLCNQLPDEKIVVGQTLVIPRMVSPTERFHDTSSSQPQGEMPLVGIVHEVKDGETLYGIARRYGVKVDDILTWNKKKTTTLFVGEKLRIFSSQVCSNLPPENPTPELKAKYQRPSSGSRLPVDEKNIEDYSRTARGVKIKVKEATTLVATVSGKVEYTGWLYGFGHVVIILMGEEKRLVLGDLDGIMVRKGQWVKPSDEVATIGAGGVFYLEVRIGTTVLDPLN